MDKNNVVINKKIFGTSKSFEVIGDIIVPDIKPDIVSIINTNANSYIYKEDISGGKIRFDGNVDTYIVYLADNGENRSIQTTLNFAESIEDSSIFEGAIVKDKVFIEQIEAKVLNERKISIKANLKLNAEVYEKIDVEIPSNFDTDKDTQIRKETLEIKSIVGVNKVRTGVKEDIAVDSSIQVAEILKTSIEISNIENKISYNKVLAKADGNIKIVFLTEDGKISVVETKIPIMSFIDIENVSDSHICNVEYTIRNMLFKANNVEMHSINCQIDFEVNCEVYEPKTIDVIQDMYGIRNNIEFTKKDVEVELNSDPKQEIVNLNERVQVEDILNIYDISVRPSVVSKNTSSGMCNYECEASLDIFYEADNRNGINVKTIKLPFMIKFDEGDGDINFSISKKVFTVRDGNVDLEVQIFAMQANTAMKNVSIIENVEIKDAEDESDYKMFMYFVKQGDTIWNIAKKFRVSMQDIIKLNNLENPDRINIGDALYIMR